MHIMLCNCTCISILFAVAADCSLVTTCFGVMSMLFFESNKSHIDYHQRNFLPSVVEPAFKPLVVLCSALVKQLTEACACATSLAFLIAGIQVLVIQCHHSRTTNSLICM